MDEMNILRNELDKRGIVWEDKSSPTLGITRTHFYRTDGVKCNVIFGDFTYGSEKGLLEVMPPLHPYYYDDEFSCEGWCTAEEIIATWL